MSPPEQDQVFGALLIERGLLTPRQLDEARRLQAGRSLAQTLAELRWVDLNALRHLWVEAGAIATPQTRGPSPWTPAPAAPPAPAEHRCGPYELRSLLGQGGFGTVHAAWDPRHEREVAVKILRRAADERTRLRFDREIKATARLQHDHIIPLLDSGEDAGRLYLVTPLIRGRTLAELVREAPGLEERVRVVRDIARAIEYAHEHQVLHRDIKPHNILVDEGGRAVILDFGLARLVDRDSRLTVTGGALGTPVYMAPEQLGSGAELDERTDVYGLGSTLYHALTGAPPFDAATQQELAVALLSRDPAPPSHVNRKVPVDLDTICLKCLEKEPPLRYAGAGELAADLERWLADEPIMARPLGVLGRAQRWGRRHRVLVGAVAGVTVLAGVGVGVWAREARRRAETEAREAKLKVQVGDLNKQLADVSDDAARQREEDAKAETRRAEEVRRCLVEAARGSKSWDHQEALDRVVKNGNAKSVLVIVERLEASTRALLRAERQVLLSAKDATPEEARAGQGSVAGLEEALERRARAGLEPVPLEVSGPLQKAAARLLRRNLRGVPDASRPQRYHVGLMSAAAQDELLGLGGRRVTQLCCDALGRIGVRAAVVPALGRYLAAESSEEQAIRAGLALCKLGGPEAQRLVTLSLRRFPTGGNYAGQVVRALEEAQGKRGPRGAAERSGVTLKTDRRELADLVARAKALEQRGDRAGALRVYDAALKREPSHKILLYNRANLRADLGDLRGAIGDLDRVLVLDPRFTLAWINRGYCKNKLNDRPGALADYDRALQLDAGNVIARSNRAWVRTNTGDLAGARKDLDRALEIDPSHSPAWQNRGALRLREGDGQGALQDYRRAVKLAPTRARSWDGLGQALMACGDSSRAAVAYRRSLQLDAKSAATWNNLGGALSRLGDHRAAVGAFARSVELQPSAVAFANRGSARREVGLLASALQDCNKAIELDARCAVAWRNRALVWRAKKNSPKAVLDARRATELDPDHVDGWNILAVTLWEADSREDSLAAFDRLIKLAPRSVQAHRNRAIMRQRQGDSKGSLSDADKAIELDPRSAAAWSVRSWTRFKMGDREGALKDISRALELDPKSEYAWSNRAYYRQAAGRLDAAAADCAQALKLAPELGDAFLVRGLIHAGRGETKKAIADLERYLKLEPKGEQVAEARAKLKALRGR